MAVECAGRVGEQVAVAQRGGLQGRVDLIGLGRDPTLIHLLDPFAAPRDQSAFPSLDGEHVGIADCDDRGLGGA